MQKYSGCVSALSLGRCQAFVPRGSIKAVCQFPHRSATQRHCWELPHLTEKQLKNQSPWCRHSRSSSPHVLPQTRKITTQTSPRSTRLAFWHSRTKASIPRFQIWTWLSPRARKSLRDSRTRPQEISCQHGRVGQEEGCETPGGMPPSCRGHRRTGKPKKRRL